MTEIKFKSITGTSIPSINIPAGDTLVLNVKNGNLVRYTGLKDKNGKEIYEGDIIRESWRSFGHPQGDWKHSIYVMEWVIRKEDGEYDTHTDGYSGFNNNWMGEVEIIGNIYQNPELIDG